MATFNAATTPVKFGSLTARNFDTNSFIGTKERGIGFLKNFGQIQLVSQQKNDLEAGEIKRENGFEAKF